MFLSCFSLLLLLLSFSSISHATDTTNYIDCSDPCNGGDVNYELVSSIRTMKMLNYTYRGRTYSTEDSPSFMGPTMHVKAGQSLWIKLRNEMYDSMGPSDVTALDYWNMLRNPGENIKYQYYKKPVANASLLKVDTPNIPKHFDDTNLHLHGLDVQVHMFDPIHTHNPAAPHVQISPGNCYCYKFNLPTHQPDGLYWYHPHLHGSSAIQIWSGMLGLLYVHGTLEEELLHKYGVTNSQEFVIWDPVFRQVTGKTTHNLEVDEFLKGQTTLSKIHPFLVNGELTPSLHTRVGEILHLRTLCATIENEVTFIVYRKGEETKDWNEAAIPFYVIASDGVTYSKPIQRTILVLAGGQREEILLKLNEPGEYVISQQGIQGMQFFDMWGHPHDQILATITVTEDASYTSTTSIPIADMTFTPGYKEEESIQAHDIAQTETIVFSMGANRDEAPFPQYFVNGQAFDPDRLDFFAQPGEAREYILINANHNVHPFHIHVNRFQVQEMGSELSIETYPVLKAVMDFDPKVWRDTVVVPPNGRARIWVQYKNYTGKTVFHCHFLAHEDTGMMSTLFIGPQDTHFVWREHLELVLGVSVAVLASLVALLAVRLYTCRQPSYEPVTMNELKSKARD